MSSRIVSLPNTFLPFVSSTDTNSHMFGSFFLLGGTYGAANATRYCMMVTDVKENLIPASILNET